MFSLSVHTHFKNQEKYKCNNKEYYSSEKNFASERPIEEKEMINNDMLKKKGSKTNWLVKQKEKSILSGGEKLDFQLKSLSLTCESHIIRGGQYS